LISASLGKRPSAVDRDRSRAAMMQHAVMCHFQAHALRKKERRLRTVFLNRRAIRLKIGRQALTSVMAGRCLKSRAFAQAIPLPQCHQFQAQAPIVDAKIIVEGVTNDGIGTDQGNLLRQHADIHRVAPQVSIPVQPEAIVATADQSDVTLQPNIGNDNCRRISGVRVEAPGAAGMATDIHSLPRLRRRSLPRRRETPANQR